MPFAVSHCTVKYSCETPPPCPSLSKTATVGARARTHMQDTCLRSHTRAHTQDIRAHTQDIRAHARAQVSRAGLSGVRPAEADHRAVSSPFASSGQHWHVESSPCRSGSPGQLPCSLELPELLAGPSTTQTAAHRQTVGPRVTSFPVRNNRAGAGSVAAGEGPSL